MSDVKRMKDFALNGAAITKDLNDVMVKVGAKEQTTAIETAADELIDRFVRQFDFKTRTDAKRMSAIYEIVYMLENEIRDFIEDTLSDEAAGGGASWWPDRIPPNVLTNAKANRDREAREGVTVRSSRMIDYTNFGELGEIIKANWTIFGGVLSNIDGMQKVLARLNMLRNYVAHSTVMDPDEVVRLKLSVRDWFRLFE